MTFGDRGVYCRVGRVGEARTVSLEAASERVVIGNLDVGATMNERFRRIREERGAAIALVALSMIAMLSAVALAVDVGMLVTARTEAQTIVDGAALAGARMLRDGGSEAQARAEAVAAGSNDNTVQGSNVTILP
jgi:Flp pilus assembly protein TadG